MGILKLLSSDNFIAVNKTVAEEVGLEAAVVLGELASEFNYWQSIGKLEEGYFYSTIENLEKKTYLSAYSQRQALAKLQEKGWISIIKKGLPAKRYIKVNENNLLMFFNDKSLKNLTTGDSNFEQQEVQNFDVNKNISKENIEEKKEDIKPPISPRENLFELFWQAYPQCFRKSNKKGCKAKFIKIKDLETIFPDIIDSLEMQKRSKQWNEKDGQYIPAPLTWINQERWTVTDMRTETQIKIDDVVKENSSEFLI